MNHLLETLISKLICLILQQKQILKNATGVDTSKLAEKSGLLSLTADVDELDIDKLVSVPVGLS